MIDLDELVDTVSAVVDSCRPLVRSHLAGAGPAVWQKRTAHGSEPVSSIDIAVHERIVTGLAGRLPTAVCISEESPPARGGAVPDDGLLAVIDPIDGTKAMIAGRPDFAICVALVLRRRAVVGLVDYPAQDRRVLAVADRGTWLDGERVSVLAEAGDPVRIAVSRRALGHPVLAMLDSHLDGVQCTPVGAFSPKALAILTGSVDAAVYLPDPDRPFAVWDILAGALALTNAGAVITDLAGRPLAAKMIRLLGDDVYYDSSGWVAGRAGVAGRLLDALATAEGLMST